MCVSYEPINGLAQKWLLCSSVVKHKSMQFVLWGGGVGGLGETQISSLDNTHNSFVYEASTYDMRIGNFMRFLS